MRRYWMEATFHDGRIAIVHRLLNARFAGNLAIDARELYPAVAGTVALRMPPIEVISHM
jgi:hypothetical protein